MVSRADVIRMAREAGLTDPDLRGDFMIDYGGHEKAIMRLAHLIASHVAGECAKVVKSECIGFKDDDEQLNRIVKDIRSLYKPTVG